MDRGPYAELVWIFYGIVWLRALKVSRAHWFYTLGPRKYQKGVGLIHSVRESIKKAVVLQATQPKVLQNYWFHCKTGPGNRLSTDSTGFGPKSIQKVLVLHYHTIGSNKNQKGIGSTLSVRRSTEKAIDFTVSVRKSIEKAMVSQG